MRIIIAGSRNYDDYETLERICNEVIEKLDIDKSKIVINCGKATGADTLGEQFAREYGLAIHYYKADWKLYGHCAGPIRNKEMAENGDVLIAFPLGDSKGTLNMVKEAMKLKLKVYVYEKDKLLESK